MRRPFLLLLFPLAFFALLEIHIARCGELPPHMDEFIQLFPMSCVEHPSMAPTVNCRILNVSLLGRRWPLLSYMYVRSATTWLQYYLPFRFLPRDIGWVRRLNALVFFLAGALLALAFQKATGRPRLSLLFGALLATEFGLYFPLRWNAGTSIGLWLWLSILSYLTVRLWQTGRWSFALAWGAAVGFGVWERLNFVLIAASILAAAALTRMLLGASNGRKGFGSWLLAAAVAASLFLTLLRIVPFYRPLLSAQMSAVERVKTGAMVWLAKRALRNAFDPACTQVLYVAHPGNLPPNGPWPWFHLLLVPGSALVTLYAWQRRRKVVGDRALLSVCLFSGLVFLMLWMETARIKDANFSQYAVPFLPFYWAWHLCAAAILFGLFPARLKTLTAPVVALAAAIVIMVRCMAVAKNYDAALGKPRPTGVSLSLEKLCHLWADSPEFSEVTTLTADWGPITNWRFTAEETGT